MIQNISICGYRRGKGVVSGGIRWFSHSLYSHVSILVEHAVTEFENWEAVERGFVCVKGSSRRFVLGMNHDAGQLVDIKTWTPPLTVTQKLAGYNYLKEIEDWPYDFNGIMNFLTGGTVKQRAMAMFCSEAAQQMSLKMGRTLQNAPAYLIDPGMCMMSLALTDVETIEI